ncbi:MAG: hypothetical protein GY859_07000 [Desulfobacterales bacterium]|nr:hypothetical protein [Desulfobacterales bacterium]
MKKKKSVKKKDAKAMEERWRDSWPGALTPWSGLVKLREPAWCFTDQEAREEGLRGSFAMIRLTDHLVVINLARVVEHGVGRFAKEILAHEIGHHVMIPANLHDNARLLSRIRWGLAGLEDRAPFVSNLYADQLINHHLRQEKGLDMAAVFRKLGPGVSPSPVWTWSLRVYEHLWGLERGDLIGKQECDDAMDADASLGASLIRSYAREWMDGAGRYAALIYPYIAESDDFKAGKISVRLFDDASGCGKGGVAVSGLAEIDERELEEIVDPRLEALGQDREEAEDAPSRAMKPASAAPGRSQQGGKEVGRRYREPGEYLDLMKQVDPSANENDILIRYYRELAAPHLVPFPMENESPISEMLPEGTDVWESGDSMEELDFLESALASPRIIPGFTTRKRVFGPMDDPGEDPTPLDLYIGIDCSGSMVNPACSFSWPVLAGAVVGLSALRAGASVKAVLSGEPGRYMETPGFSASEHEVLNVLTDYLGTGYAFGIPRLNDTFRDSLEKKTHILIISDDDIFSMLGAGAPGGGLNWEIARRAVANARGGGTMVLHSRPAWRKKEVKRLEKQGWEVRYVTNEEELLDFAKAFAERRYLKSE